MMKLGRQIASRLLVAFIATSSVMLGSLTISAAHAGAGQVGPQVVQCVSFFNNNNFGPCPLGSPTIVAFASAGSGGSIGATADGRAYTWDLGQITSLGLALNAPITGLAGVGTALGNFWMVGADGGVFTVNRVPGGQCGGQPTCQANFFGSMGGQPLNAPIVSMASTPDGQGYWLVAADGGIFSFGNAGFFGSMGGQHLNAPVVGMAPSIDGHGYYLVAADGGVFAFGDAPFFGSMAGTSLNAPVVGISTTYDNSGDPARTSGYYLAGSDGSIFAFGAAPFTGSGVDMGLGPVIGVQVAVAGRATPPTFFPVLMTSGGSYFSV